MKTLHFTTTIAAPPARVWDTMLGPDTYPAWTAAFAEGSRYEGSWGKGQRIRFLGASGGGMEAEIAENRPHEFLSIRHLGPLKNGVDANTSDGAEQWAGAYENYTFTDRNGATELRVDQDVVVEYEDHMAKTWPKALAMLKALCEKP